MSEEACIRAGRYDTATISDALDKLGIAGQCLGIKPLLPSFDLVGRAFTLLYAPVVQGGTVGDYIDDIPPGAVAVLDNAGREDASVWGDILTFVAHRRKLGGTVIDGACRDTRLSRELSYPMFSRTYTMRTGKDRVQLERMGGTVVIGGARVAQGDLIRGDADGVVAIPRDREEEVLAVAEQIHAAEERIRAGVIAGSRLDEARRANKYHSLQKKAVLPQ